MSSLNSVSSLNFNPFQYLALLESQAASSGSGTTSTSSASGTTAASAASGTTQWRDQFQFAGPACHGHYQRRADRRAVGQHLEPQFGHPGCREPGLPGERHQPGDAPAGRLGQVQGRTTTITTIMAARAARRSGAGSTGTTTSSDATTQTGTASTTAATQPTSNQQTADLLALISGTSGGNQSINGFLLNVQT